MRREVKIRLLFRLGVIFTLVALSIASLYIGSGEVSVSQVTHILTEHVTEGTEAAVVWQLRFPRAIVALCTGFALGMAGAIIQTMTHNPLAEPGLLGVNSGASLVVASAIVFFSAASFGAQLVVAMVGAFASGIVVLGAGGVFSHSYDSVKLMLAGSAFSALSGAATRYLSHV